MYQSPPQQKYYLSPTPLISIRGVASATQADLDNPLTVQQSLLHTASEGSAMADLLSQNHITGVSMGINMDQTHRAMPNKQKAVQS